MMVILIAWLLASSAVAQENDAPATNGIVTQQQSADAKAYPQGSHDDAGHTITVDVWSPSPSNATPPNEGGPAKVSRNFAAAGLNAAFRMESTERKIENSLRRGFPLGEFWIHSDLAEIDDSLKVAELSVANNSDREALQQLEQQSKRLHAWSDWLIQKNRNLALTEYYISSSTLDKDESFQSSVACTKFLVSMLASRRLAEDSSCL
jgi:hypothetical protein